MYLYKTSIGGFKLPVYRNVSAPRVFDEFIEYAVSKSLFAGSGCQPEKLGVEKLGFIGGWSWEEVAERFAQKNTTTAITTTTVVTVESQGYGGEVYVYMAVAGVFLLAVAMWVGRSGEKKSAGRYSG